MAIREKEDGPFIFFLQFVFFVYLETTVYVLLTNVSLERRSHLSSHSHKLVSAGMLKTGATGYCTMLQRFAASLLAQLVIL